MSGSQTTQGTYHQMTYSVEEHRYILTTDVKYTKHYQEVAGHTCVPDTTVRRSTHTEPYTAHMTGTGRGNMHTSKKQIVVYPATIRTLCMQV